MAKTKTIVAPITLIVADGKDNRGKIITKEIEPGTPLTLPSDEADSLIRLHGAVEVDDDAPKGRKADASTKTTKADKDAADKAAAEAAEKEAAEKAAAEKAAKDAADKAGAN